MMRREHSSTLLLPWLIVAACSGGALPEGGAGAANNVTPRAVPNPSGDCVARADGSRAGHAPNPTDVYLPDCGASVTREYYRVFVQADDTAYMIPRPDGHPDFYLPCRGAADDPLRQALERYALCGGEALTPAQVQRVNSMSPVDALHIAHHLNDTLVFVVGPSGVEPSPFPGDVLEVCKADEVLRSGLLSERCDFELQAEASGVRPEMGWNHTGKAGLVLASALDELYGLRGDELCVRLTNAASRSLLPVVEAAAAPCTSDADCAGIAQASECHDACGGVVAAARSAEVDAARAAINAAHCAVFERASCTLIVPPCVPPGTPACLGGACRERR